MGEGRSLSVLQKKHLGIRRQTFHPVFLNVREIPETKPESSSLLPFVCGFYHIHLQFAEFCVDTTTPQPVTVLSESTGPEALSRSEEGAWLLFSALVKCCGVDQGQLPKDHCRSRNDVMVTPAIFWNVSNSVVYTNSYDVDASLCRGSHHLKKDD